MRFGTRFGIAAVLLLVLGPFINRNFGLGDGFRDMPLSALWETAPVAVVVSLAYVVLLAISVLLCAALITTSLVIRHSEASELTTADKDSTSVAY